MRRFPVILIACICLCIAQGCKRVPGDVIQPDTMAALIADLNIAQSVVDQNYQDWRTDSAKQALKQAVYERHGVDQAMFDSSLVWYGHHADKYMDVYDRAIKILEAREQRVTEVAVEAAVAAAGDSVDLWTDSRYAVLNPRLPTRAVEFDIDFGDGEQTSDIFSWNFKLVDDFYPTVRWNFVANYADSTLEWMTQTTNTSGWNTMTFQPDSVRTLTRLRGSFVIEKGDFKSPELWIDSIRLVRRKVQPDAYTMRFRARTYLEY